MRVKLIDLRSKSPGQAKKIIKRLYNFKSRIGSNVSFKFLLPDKDSKKQQKAREVKKCPYCSSPLVENGYNIVCSNLNMKIFIDEMKEAKEKYREKAHLFLSTKAGRFYGDYLLVGDELKCEYVKNFEESKFV